MRPSLRFIAVAAAIALVGSACGDDDTGTDEATDTSGAVGGTVTLVTHDSFSVSDDVLADFEAASGIDVQIVKGGDAGTVVNQAVLTAGDPVGDVLYGVDNTFLTRALDADVFEPYESPELAAVDQTLVVDDEHRVTPVDVGDVCLNYDREYFSGELAPPSSLDDLIDPAYADLTVVEDAALSSPGLAFLLATVAEYGDGWPAYWESLVDNGVLVAPDWESAYYTNFTVGGGGDRPIVVSYASSPPADVVFAPEPKDEPSIGAVTESCFRQIEFAGVLRGASNPQGAHELLDFMLSDEFQADMPLNMFVFPARTDVDLPEVFAEFAEVPQRPYEISYEEIGEGRDEWIDQWTEIVGA